MCSMLCQKGYDVTRNVPDIYVCGGSGKWFPNTIIRDCDGELILYCTKLNNYFIFLIDHCFPLLRLINVLLYP